MDKKKYILIFTILVLIIGSGIFAWQYFGVPKNEAVNWQTYRNEEYDFEIKYPSDWTYQEKATQYGISGYRTEFFDRQGKFILQIENSIPETAPTVPIQNIEKKEISIRDSVKTLQKIKNYLPESGDYMVFAQWNFTEDYLKSGRISLPLYKNELDSNLVIFDQILSTFKFIDETADWKTYRDEKYGFELKYPDTKDILLIAQGDGQRDFLFGGVDCGVTEGEANYSGARLFFPIEAAISNPDYNRPYYSREECDQAATRWVLHGRFCTNRNIAEYMNECGDNSNAPGYHRYDIYVACTWPGESGRIQCTRLFNQITDTFKFIK